MIIVSPPRYFSANLPARVFVGIDFQVIACRGELASAARAARTIYESGDNYFAAWCWEVRRRCISLS